MLLRTAFLALASLLALANLAPAQMTPEQQAELLLNSARKAYNEKNHTFAQARFREFLGKFPQHKEVPAARYGLALTLIEGPEKKFDEAREIMLSLNASKDFPDQALAGYYAGVASRGMGLNELALADAQPAEAAKRRAAAQARFEESASQFAKAVDSLAGNAKEPIKDDKLTLEAEWVARAMCDQAEMQIRVGKPKEAQVTATAFVGHAVWSKSQYRNLGRYCHGYASVLLKDHAAGQKTLSMLAPFADPVFGNHARYLLARTHHLAEERAEATTHYDGAIADFAKSRAEAALLLKQPAKFNNDPETRIRLEALVKNPPPDHVARATFYLGVLHYEAGKFGDAKLRFAEFVKQFPQSPLKLDAEVRFGYCQVQLKEFGDAVKTLTPLVDREARLSDQVLFWLGKAQVGTAPDASVNLQAHQQVVAAALNTFKTAADWAGKLGEQDAEAKARRGEILLEMADQMQRIWQNKEAAAVYNLLLNEKLLSDREEEVMQRWCDALHLAGAYDDSDKVCVAFQQRFAQSTLMPAVLFTFAENSYFRIVALEKNPKHDPKELANLFVETTKRFRAVVERFPGFPKANVARYSLGLTLFRNGDLAAAHKILSEIPAPDRGGDLALASYMIADCLLRQTPTTVPDDALAAGKMEEQLKGAAEALEAFVSAQPRDVNTPDALLKLGLTQQRLAALIAQPPERVKKYNEARATYERLMRPEFAKAFPNSAVHTAHATFERAKCITFAGDMNTGIGELRKFTTDPFRQTPVAPLAVLQLATYLRAQNKPNEAADVLAKNREFLESVLAKSPDKGPAMIALLRYHHGVALREMNKLREAREMFETVVKMGIQRIEATEAALRVGQCLKDEGQQQLEVVRKLKANAKKPEELAIVQKQTDEAYKFIRDSVTYLETQSDQIKASPALQEQRARMLYEAAWGARLLAEPEIESARAAIMQENLKKLDLTSSKFPLPEVPLDKVPLQPSEKRARGLYKLLIDQTGDAAIATEARFELAELLSQRNEHDPAIALLTDVLDKEPSPDMTEKVRLWLGGIQAAKGNIKAALTQFNAVASNAKSPLLGWANYRAGEALIQDQQYGEAIKRLTMFRDQPNWNNVPGLTDRALLRLGYAYAVSRSWDESRVALERLVNAFPNSPWHDEARYGIGWALQQQKNYDAAANAYSIVVSRTATDLAAKSQLQIGLCRMDQKRYLDAANAFLVIPSTYDYPELRAAALLEAGKAYLELNQREQANRQFERILREFPNTPWADAAKEKLGTK